MSSKDHELWALYLEALQKALLLPDLESFLATGLAFPLSLNVASTTVQPIPVARALAEIYLLANGIPDWGQPYRRSVSGVFGQFEAFVYAIKTAGNRDPRIEQARQLLEDARRQLEAGHGDLVMRVATDAGESTVPRFDPSPLGEPGFSLWLDLAILAAANKLPPQIDVTVDANAPASASEERSRELTRDSALPPFFRLGEPGSEGVTAKAEIAEPESLRLKIQSVTRVSVSPGGWFMGSLLTSYIQRQDFCPGTPFRDHPIWGPQGIFSTIPTALAAGFRPDVTVKYPPDALAELQRLAEVAAPMEVGIGPFAFRLGGEEVDFSQGDGVVVYSSKTLVPQMLGMVVDHPNYPSNLKGETSHDRTDAQ